MVIEFLKPVELYQFRIKYTKNVKDILIYFPALS